MNYHHWIVTVLFAAWMTASPLVAQNPSAAATAPTARMTSTKVVHVWIVGKLWTGQGAPIENGAIVVADGKIVSVGPASEIQIPSGAVRHELPQCQLVPGLVIAETSLAGGDDDEQAITPYFRAIDSFDYFGDYNDLLAQGITTVQIAPGTARLMPGQSAVVKLAGDDLVARTLSESESLRILLTSIAFSPPTVYEPPIGAVSETRPLEPTRPQLASSLSGAVAGLRVLFRSASDDWSADPLSSQDVEILSSLRRAANHELPIRMTAVTSSEIRAAAQLANELKIKPLLVNPEPTDAVSHWLVGDDSPFRGFVLPLPTGVDRMTNRPLPAADRVEGPTVWETAARLRDGNRWNDVAIGSTSREELSKIWFTAGLLKRGGLSNEQILAVLTANAAQLLGIADRVGSLQSGKDADFVILSGGPFERNASVIETVIAGQSVWKKTQPVQAGPTAHVIRAGSVYTDHGAWEGAEISVLGSSIVDVGENVSVPDQAIVDSFPNAVIVPGMMDLNTTLAFGGALNNQLALNSKLGELLISEDPAVAAVRQAGITTVLAAPARLPGPVIAYKLTDRPQVLRDPVALRFEVSANLTQAASTLRSTLSRGKDYYEQWKRYDAAMVEYNQALKVYETKLAEYEAAKTKLEQEKAAAEKAAAEKAAAEKATTESGAAPGAGTGNSPPAESKPAGESGAAPAPAANANASGNVKPTDGANAETKQAPAAPAVAELKAPEKPAEPRKPNASATMEPFRDLFAGKIPAMVEAQQFKAIELAVQIFAVEFELSTIITGASDLPESRVALQHPKVSVVVGPSLSSGNAETKVNLPQWLATHRVPFAFRSNGETGSAQLPLAIEYATYQGLGVADAVRGLSEAPAKFLGLQNVGGLAAGRDADLVVLSGPPFELGTEVIAVMINGEWVYKKESR